MTTKPEDVADAFIKELMDQAKLTTKAMVKKRAARKREITLLLQKLEDVTLTSSFVNKQIDNVKEKARSIEEIDQEIIEAYETLTVDEYCPERFEELCSSQVNYMFDLEKKISDLEPPNIGNSSRNDANFEPNQSAFIQELGKLFKTSQAKVQEIKLPTFSGSHNEDIQFSDFLNQFEDLIGNRSDTYSGSTKLVYLKSYLRGGALDIIKHLSNENENYEVALKFLKQEYLDPDVVIDKHIQSIIKLKAPVYNNFEEMRIFLNSARTSIYELKKFGYDALEDNTLGNKMISFLLCERLPSNFKVKLSQTIKTDYPTTPQILDNYSNVIRSLEKNYSKREFVKKTHPVKQSPTTSKKGDPKIHEYQYTSSLQNFKTQTKSEEEVTSNSKHFKKVCKLCGDPHSLVKCNKFTTAESRIKRLKQLNLCESCSGKHKSTDCPALKVGLTYPCATCDSKTHITAVCKKLKQNQTESNLNNMCIINNKSQINDSRVLIPSMTMIMEGQGSVELVRCMIDPGSQSSYISENLRNKLNLKTTKSQKTFQLKTFMGSCEKKYDVVKCLSFITPKTKVNAEFLVDKDFNVNYSIPGIRTLISELNKENFIYADSSFYDIENDTLDNYHCLIGANLVSHLTPLTSIEIGNGAAYEVHKAVILFGDIQEYLPSVELENCLATNEQSYPETKEDIQVNFIVNPRDSYFNPMAYAKSESDIDLNIENMFRIESLGISESDNAVVVNEVLEKFDRAIEYKDGHYHVELPFKEEVKNLKSNWKIAQSTMYRVYQSLKEKKLLDKYTNIFRQQEKDNIIESLNISEKDYENYIFIPHHPVIKEDSQVTTKIRAVFNCSFKHDFKSYSLNQTCYEGIDLLHNLVELLMRFRQNKYTLIGDIEKAFLQVLLKNEEDKNKFCFFWMENGNLKVYRYRSIIFGLNVSPFVLNRIIQYHLEKYGESETINALKEGFYVDNFIYSTSDAHTLHKVYKESIEIMSQGGFNLRSFMTNYLPLRQEMERNNTIVCHDEPVEKLLGYNYNPINDTLSLNAIKFPDHAKLTKRYILSSISKIFDPLSLTLPVTIRGRILMKQIWAEKTAWDEEVSQSVKESWNKLETDLQIIMGIDIPRITTDNNNKYIYHVFCDGSKTCYGFSSYAVNINSSELLFAKGKVTPKNKSVPQIELLSVFLAFKCLPLIIESHKIENDIHFWIDAQIVLEWILSGCKTKNKFTRNRVLDILNMKDELSRKNNINFHFHYVESKQNPSDMITRGLTAKTFISEQNMWMHGPEWICNKMDWPKHELKCLSEQSKIQVNNNLNMNIKDTKPVVDIHKYSSFQRIINVTSKVFKFVNKLKKREADSTSQARIYLLRSMQNDCFSKEFQYLWNIRRDSKCKLEVPLNVDEFNLFINEDGLLCCRGRISKSQYFSNNALLPVLLSKNHPLTRMIVNHYHQRCRHLGLGTTLMMIRENGYWLPRGRQVIKDILNECITCKKLNVRAFQLPKLTNLPKERICLIKPYLHTGIDYTAHLFIKDGYGVMVKMYIVVYTCLGLRSVHLDLVPDMTLKSFLSSFQRFVNIYGVPDSIYTDNAKQFTASKPYLSDIFLSDELSDYLTQHSIQHKTIPVYASWVGGVYERQVKTVKSCLYKSVGRSKLNYFEMITVLSSIQNAINSRPITYVYSELNEIDALTPNKILKLSSNPGLQWKLDNDVEDGDSLWNPASHVDLHQAINNNLNAQQRLVEDYKKLWYSQYLLSLRETSKYNFQSQWENRIKVNDIVLIDTKDKPRIYWSMGRVVRLFSGDDGNVRSVLLKVSNGQEKHYSIRHLYPLEVQTSHLGVTQQVPVGAGTENEQPPVMPVDQIPNEIDHNKTSSPKAKPKRKAALKQRSMLTKIINRGDL